MPQLYDKESIASKEHTQLALQSARESIVLLKNDGILPLDMKKVKKMVILGELAVTPNIGDKGSSRVYPPYVITPLQGIKTIVRDNINIIYNSGSNFKNVEKDLRDADIILLIVGYTHKQEGEYVYTKGGDRDSLKLKEEDEDLIKSVTRLNSNCVVVLEGGSAIITENWRQNVPSILMAWYPGMEGGTALAEILFGKINPSAKLPLTFPKSKKQLPYFNKDATEICYDYFHGYWLFDKEGQEAAFPFGFGLSYTNFSYSNLRIDKESIKVGDMLSIKIDVKNIGTLKGKEIVQLYVGYYNSVVERPEKELKGFQKVEIDPDEKKTIIFQINSNDLAYYNLKKKSWIVEKIKYKILVGPSSKKEDLLTAEFMII
jgi:beta-glucosidase